MNRGDRREEICRDGKDRQRFLTTLGEACAKTGWQVHALGLMPNQFHLVVDRLLGEHGIGRDSAAGRRRLGAALEAPRGAADGQAYQPNRRGWAEATLAARPKDDSEKVAIAQRLQRQTTGTLGWIAQRLQMGAKTPGASALLAGPGWLKDTILGAAADARAGRLTPGRGWRILDAS